MLKITVEIKESTADSVKVKLLPVKPIKSTTDSELNASKAVHMALSNTIKNL